MTRDSLFLVVASVVGLTVSGCSTLFPGNSTNSGPTTATGCTAMTKAVTPLAPGGYYVNGNTICTADGQAHLFHGVDRPSLEFEASGDHLSLSDFQLMASWNANVVRIALNQDHWLEGSPQYNPSYASIVDDAVHWAEEAGMDVILDLHWSDQGTLGSCDQTKTTSGTCQQTMADSNSVTFWQDVASIYKGDGRVLFELYNEPHDVPWNVWKSGGTVGVEAAGMQQLYDTVRATGADNLVVVGGLNWAYDLSGVPANRISGYNIVYATHPYLKGDATTKPGGFDAAWGFLTKTDPVIVTEFGDGTDCAAKTMFTDAVSTYDSAVIAYADQHNASWTAWAWYPGSCTSFPSLISDWTGTPTPIGTLVHAALAGYGQPAPDGKRDGGQLPDAGHDGAAATLDGGARDAGETTGDGGEVNDASLGG